MSSLFSSSFFKVHCFSHMDSHLFEHCLLKRISIPCWINHLGCFVKNQLIIYVCLFLMSLLCSIDLYVHKYVNTTLFWLQWFYSKFLKSGSTSSSTLFFIFNSFFGYISSLHFHIQFRIIFLISTIKATWIFIEIVWNP